MRVYVVISEPTGAVLGVYDDEEEAHKLSDQEDHWLVYEREVRKKKKKKKP